MKWIDAVFGHRIRKTICTALTLLFLAGGLVNGALAGGSCGSSCCCQIKAETMHHDADEQRPSSAGCCDGNSTTPCNLRTGSLVPISVYILSNASANGSGMIELAGPSIPYLIGSDDTVPSDLLAVAETSQPPRLYLQQSALRI